MKKLFFGLFFVPLLSMIFLITSTLNNANTERVVELYSASVPCHMVQHAMGETCVPLSPQRIVTLDSFVLGDVLALLDVQPVGTMIYEEELGAPYLEGKVGKVQPIRAINGQVNLERILLIKPDLIVGLSGESQIMYQQLSQIAPTVLLPWKEISYDWKQRFQYFASMFDKMEIAEKLIAEYHSRVEKLRQTLDRQHQQIRASILYVVPGQFFIALQDSFAGSILSEANLLPPSRFISTSSHVAVSEEILPQINSEVLFVLQYRKPGVMKLLKRLQQHPLWSKLKAVKLHQVYMIDDRVWHGYNLLSAHAVIDDLTKYLTVKS